MQTATFAYHHFNNTLPSYLSASLTHIRHHAPSDHLFCTITSTVHSCLTFQLHSHISNIMHPQIIFSVPSLQQYTPVLPFSFTHTYQTSCTLRSSFLYHHFNSTLLSYLSASLTHIKHHAPSDHLFCTITSTVHSCLTFQLHSHISNIMHPQIIFSVPSLQQYTPVLPFSFTHTYQTSCTLRSSFLYHHFNSTLLSYLSASLTHIKHHAPSDHLFCTITSTVHSCLTFQLHSHISNIMHPQIIFSVPSLQQYTPVLPFSFTHTYQTSCTLRSSFLYHHFNSTLLSYLSASLTHIKHHAPSDHLFCTITSTVHSCLTFQLHSHISNIMHPRISFFIP